MTPGVWIGRKVNQREAKKAIQDGVKAVLDLTGEFSEVEAFKAVRYLNMPILDLTAPTREQLKEMSAFIAAESSKGVVYVHCKIGYSRSAAAAGAYLLDTGLAGTADHAIATLRRVRPSIIIRPEIISALEDFSSLKRAECG